MATIITVTPSPAVDIFTSTPALTPFGKLRCAAPRRDAGGGGINVARVAHRLGGDVIAAFPIGGCSGSLLSRLLQSEGVSTLEIPAKEETRQDFTVVEEATKRQYRFILPGAGLDTGEWQECLDAVQNFADPKTRIMVASGSLPDGVPVDFYARLAGVAKARGCKLLLDCSGEPLKAALREGVYLIKPNLREFQELTGKKLIIEGDLIAAGRELIADNACDLVALTLGPDGALLIARDTALRADGIPVTVASVVGAGDSFMGAFAWCLASEMTIEHAFRFGVAAGTAAVLSAGTQLCRPDETRRLFDQVRLRSL